MTITKTFDGEKMTVQLEGRLDTTTAPELEASLGDYSEAEGIVLDLTDLQYISSAGLRVVLAAHKAMAKKGGLVITNVADDIMEVFEITGFADILTIE